MIIGIGSDLSDIRRIAKTLERFGDRFTHKTFTEIERARSDRKTDRAASYAKRFAAKEACSKALGTGLSHGVFWRGRRNGRGPRKPAAPSRRWPATSPTCRPSRLSHWPWCERCEAGELDRFRPPPITWAAFRDDAASE